MTNKRTGLLLLILLMLMSLYIYNDFAEKASYDNKTAPPLPGKTEILGFVVERRENLKHFATIQYFYTGEPRGAILNAVASGGGAGVGSANNPFGYFVKRVYLVRGRNTVELEIQNPRKANQVFKQTQSVTVNIVQFDNLIQKLEKDYVIEWLDPRVIEQKAFLANSTVGDLYKASVALVDIGTRSSLSDASKYLESIIIRNPDYGPAYIEMARVEMKTGWNEEGLRKAESHLNSAINIDMENANAHVLMGYVYTYQKKFDKALLAFEKAESIGTKNLWLWANWGEMLVFQEKNQEAIEKYKMAVNARRPFNTYDRAQQDAYVKLFAIMREEKRQKEVGELLSKRMNEYANKPCFASEYAMFLAKYGGDYLEPKKIATQALEQGCRQKIGQLALGLANYFKWHAVDQDMKAASLSQARVFYPESPELYFDLLASKKGEDILGSLLAHSENDIDTKNAQNYTALSLALFAGDETAVVSLLTMQASFDLEVGNEDLPISFIPIVRDDVSMLALLKEYGVNYSTTTYVGLTAKEFSDQIGSNETSKVLPAGGRI